MFAAAATAAVPVFVFGTYQFPTRGRAKFPNGERHLAEETAGVILLLRYAFLVRNAVVGCLDEILSRAFDPDDRKDAERDEKTVFVIAVGQVAGNRR